MRKIFLLLLLITLYCTNAVAAEISSATGDFIQDAVITINGSDFGNHQLNVEWLGGTDGAIESGQSGSKFSKSGWNNSTFKDFARYDSSLSYSGEKSILFDSTSTGDGRFHLSYDIGSTFKVAYVTWMARIDTGGATGQWKMFRMNWEQNIQDTAPEVIMFNWFGSGGNMFITRRTTGETEQREYLGSYDYPGSSEWVRMEMTLKPSSAPGLNDGSVEYIIHRPGNNINIAYSDNSLETYLSGESRRWRYFVFQNYQGNGLDGRSKVWMDDIYIQNTRARVELGNAASWSNCTHREIQYPISWSNDGSSIQIKLNKGTFSAGEQVYLYVVDANGNPSDGFPVTIGGSGSTPSPTDNAPTVTITNPTSNNSYTTTSNSVDLAGTASDDFGITAVNWANDRGGSGVATDDAGNWSSFSVDDISLLEGANIITVAVTDTEGQVTTDSLSVQYAPESSPTSGTIAWNSTVNIGDSSWSNSAVTYCVRLLIPGSQIATSGNSIRLGFQGRSSGSYTIKSVSIAERDINGSLGDVIDSTWTKVTFDGKGPFYGGNLSGDSWENYTVTIPQDVEKLSNAIDFDIKPGTDYYVTFKIQTPSVYLDAPSGYQELIFNNTDHTQDIDWSGTGFTVVQDYHALSNIYITNDPVGTVIHPIPQ